MTDDVLCRSGEGNLSTHFRDYALHVGATKAGGLASRSCEATITWKEKNEIVAPDAFEIDLDALGVDMGTGSPVAAFQVKKAESDCCRTYLIYPLNGSDQILRKLQEILGDKRNVHQQLPMRRK